jgi:hypothetical protein
MPTRFVLTNQCFTNSCGATAMSFSTPEGDRRPLFERTRSADYTADLCNVVARIGSAADEPELIQLLRLAIERLGAEAATFTSLIRDDLTLVSYRTILACDPRWGTEYARNVWCRDDPWLQHARQSSEPIRACDLKLSVASQRRMVEAAAEYGFRSALIVPAPSAVGDSRVGVLCIGTSTADFFDVEGCVYVKALVRGLAMELHEWWLCRLRDELVTRARITEDDLELLRHEAQGHGSKLIASALRTEAKTIDCRFQRLNYRLGVANRRDAVRLGRVYGLI